MIYLFDKLIKNQFQSEAALLFDSLLLLAITFENGNPSRRQQLQQVLSSQPARCATGTQTNRPHGGGKLLAKLIRRNGGHGLTGELGERLGRYRGQNGSGNFTFRINLIGYQGILEDVSI